MWEMVPVYRIFLRERPVVLGSNNIIKAKLIVCLRDYIRSETAKAEEEMEMDFVDNCMELLSVLMDCKYNYSDEELEEKLTQIKAQRKQL